ncbi:MAG: protein kinase family protein [Bdellovibrio sp.]|nr:protein kinase family protein [Bdellovibrio sp.]
MRFLVAPFLLVLGLLFCSTEALADVRTDRFKDLTGKSYEIKCQGNTQGLPCVILGKINERVQNPNFEKVLQPLLAQMPATWGENSRDVTHLLERWTGASYFLQHGRETKFTYQLEAFLPPLLCAEANKEAILNQCKASGRYPFVTLTPECRVQTDQSLMKVGYTSDYGCEQLLLLFPGASIGEGAFKKAFMAFLFDSFNIVTLLEFKTPYESLSDSERSRVDTELEVLELIRESQKSKSRVAGLPTIYGADHRRIYMEYFPTDLEALLKTSVGQPLLGEGWKVIASEINHALVYLHSQGIVFNDVKPGNILVDPLTLHATLTDFGLSKFLKNHFDQLIGWALDPHPAERPSIQEFSNKFDEILRTPTPPNPENLTPPEMIYVTKRPSLGVENEESPVSVRNSFKNSAKKKRPKKEPLSPRKRNNRTPSPTNAQQDHLNNVPSKKFRSIPLKLK